MRRIGWVCISALIAACAAAEPAAPPIRSVASEGSTPIEREREERWRFRQPTVAREQSVVRVLLYHSFGWFGEMRPSVSPYALKTQLDWLEAHSIEVIPLGALLDFLDGTSELPERAAVITIDDGELNGFTVAFPILRERKLPFTLALASEASSRSSTRGTIPWKTLREMLQSGLVTIASHGHAHLSSTALSDAGLERELQHSREIIERELGVRPEAFVYPLGAHDERVQRFTRAAGYRAAFAAQGGPVTVHTPRHAIPRYSVEHETSIFTFAYYFRHTLRTR